jgi:hypothetical protein
MDLQDHPKGGQGTTVEPTMKTYHALVIVPVVPHEDHVVLRIQTEEEGRIGVHMRREVLELFFEHPKTDLLRPLPASDRDTEGA